MSRRAQVPTAALAGMVALSVILGLLASLAARRNKEPAEVTTANPYLQSFEGSAQRATRDGRVQTGSSSSFAGSGASGEAAALGGTASAATSGTSGGTLPSGLNAAPKAPRLSAAVSTELGRELTQLLANADVSVLAIGHKGGSFAYSQTDGWLKLDGSSWVVTDYASLPMELRAAYPPEVYGSKGSAALQGGKGAGARHSNEGGPVGARETNIPFDPQQAAVLFEPTPNLEQGVAKKGKKAATIDL